MLGGITRIPSGHGRGPSKCEALGIGLHLDEKSVSDSWHRAWKRVPQTTELAVTRLPWSLSGWGSYR
jgi:hypothetical protein